MNPPALKPSARTAARLDALLAADRAARAPKPISQEEELRRSKEVEFYAASCGGWLNTALERDKSVFTLSAGGIGLLVTLLTAKGFTSVLAAVLYSAALLSFLASLLLVLFVLEANKQVIENLLLNPGSSGSPWLKRMDLASLTFFGIGVLFSVAIGVSTGLESLRDKAAKDQTELAICQEALKGKNMTNENQNKQRIDESFSGLNKLQQTDTLKKSFEGLQNLNPSQGQTPAANPPQPAASEPQKK